MRPSFVSHGFNGLLMTFGAILGALFVYQNWSTKRFEIIIIILILATLCGVHGLLHHMEEIFYGFNPVAGYLPFRDQPQPITVRIVQ